MDVTSNVSVTGGRKRGSGYSSGSDTECRESSESTDDTDDDDSLHEYMNYVERLQHLHKLSRHSISQVSLLCCAHMYMSALGLCEQHHLFSNLKHLFKNKLRLYFTSMYDKEKKKTPTPTATIAVRRGCI